MSYYPPSPQYKSVSTSEDEAEQISAARGKYTDPTLTPIPRDEHASMEQDEASPDRETSRSPRDKRAASNPPGEAPKATPDSTTSQEEPSLEMPEAQPVPLKPEVVVVPYPGAPITKDKDSDCEIVEPPAEMPFKPKKGWAKKRMEQTKETFVLCIPRVDGPIIKKEEAGASQMENPPAPQAEGEDSGAGEVQRPQPDSGNGSMDEMD